MPPRKPSEEDLLEAMRESQDGFVAAWGKMASSWGIPRTMAEIHALLYICGEPLNTDEVMARLQISRGNASMSLRALATWNLVRRERRRGDRKEYFETETDVWTMFRTILRERKKREIDPVLVALHEIRDGTHYDAMPEGDTADAIREHNKRLDAMIDFVDMVDVLVEQFAGPEGAGLRAAASMLGGSSDE